MRSVLVYPKIYPWQNCWLSTITQNQGLCVCTLLDLNTPICVNTTIIKNFKNLRIFVAICLHESLNLTPFCMEFVIAVNPSEGLKQNVFKSAKTILKLKKMLNLTTKALKKMFWIENACYICSPRGWKWRIEIDMIMTQCSHEQIFFCFWDGLPAITNSALTRGRVRLSHQAEGKKKAQIHQVVDNGGNNMLYWALLSVWQVMHNLV